MVDRNGSEVPTGIAEMRVDLVLARLQEELAPGTPQALPRGGIARAAEILRRGNSQAAPAVDADRVTRAMSDARADIHEAIRGTRAKARNRGRLEAATVTAGLVLAVLLTSVLSGSCDGDQGAQQADSEVVDKDQ